MKIDSSWYIKPKGISEHECAGGVVVKIKNGQIYFATTLELDTNVLYLPKGHVDEGEDIETAARREIEEETGIRDLKLIEFLGIKERLNFKKTSWKNTHYFLFTTNQEDSKPTDPKHIEVVWVSLSDFNKHLWPEQRELIKENMETIQSVVSKA